MADENRFNTVQLVFFLAIIALIVGLVFHVIFLVKDRTVTTPSDEWTAENAKMFFLLAIGLGSVGAILSRRKKLMPGASY